MTAFFVHESSVVESGARIGKGTKVWHFCHIMPDAEIGENCSFGQNCFVGKGVKIGSGCRFQNNVSVYEGVTLEEGVFCGPSCVFTNDLNPRALYPKGGQYVPTLVKKGASIGANATIVCGTTIGRWALIGAGAVVTEDVPDYALVYGVPAKVHAWVCECGEKLAFSAAEQASCAACTRRYIKSSQGVVSQRTA